MRSSDTSTSPSSQAGSASTRRGSRSGSGRSPAPSSSSSGSRSPPGYLTRLIGIRRRGRDWYEGSFIPRIAPLTLYGLLFTIVLLFAIQGEEITSEPLDVALIAAPLLVYFGVMWAAGFVAGRLLRFPYPQTAALSFTVASNDFELAIAVAVGVFGATSGQALAGVVGPLIEVPVLVALVYVALWLRRRLTWPAPAVRRTATLSSRAEDAEPTAAPP